MKPDIDLSDPHQAVREVRHFPRSSHAFKQCVRSICQGAFESELAPREWKNLEEAIWDERYKVASHTPREMLDVVRLFMIRSATSYEALTWLGEEWIPDHLEDERVLRALLSISDQPQRAAHLLSGSVREVTQKGEMHDHDFKSYATYKRAINKAFNTQASVDDFDVASVALHALAEDSSLTLKEQIVRSLLRSLHTHVCHQLTTRGGVREAARELLSLSGGEATDKQVMRVSHFETLAEAIELFQSPAEKRTISQRKKVVNHALRSF